MAPLTYKPRPKMHSWTPPLPPKPKRSKFYLWAVLGWLGATAASYLWLAGDREQGASTPAAASVVDPSALPGTVAVPLHPDAAIGVTPTALLAGDPSELRDPARPATRTDGEIRACEDFLQKANDATENRLPMHLGRSAIDVFIGENDWAKPCRTRHRQMVALCVAVRDGAVQGLTARTSPPNLTLENCLREQAKKLSLQPEGALRVIRTNIHL